MGHTNKTTIETTPISAAMANYELEEGRRNVYLTLLLFASCQILVLWSEHETSRSAREPRPSKTLLIIAKDEMFLTAVIVLAYFTAASCRNVMVSPFSLTLPCSQPCGSEVSGTSIDQALGNITSGDYLRLLPGCHCVRTFSVVRDVTDVSLIGGGGGIVQITCAPGLGLAFLNVTRLSFQGLTITGCGLNGSNAVALNTAINTMVDLFTQLTQDVSFAVIIASSTDVDMDHVTIMNTTGLGLVGVNVAGESSFTNNVFSFNMDRQCLVKYSGLGLMASYTVGGGASFTYVDYSIDSNSKGAVNLTIDNSTFSYNCYCGTEISIEVYSPLISALRSHNYTIASGGGLALSLAQRGYSVDINVQRSTFVNNEATIGSGSYVLWYAGSSDSHIVFSDCAFTRNGPPYVVGGGGGIGLFKDVLIPSGASRNGTSPESQRSNTMLILRTNFTQNSAGGIYVQSLYSTVVSPTGQLALESSRFEDNNGLSGAAVYMIEKKGHGTQQGLTATVRNCVFVGNTMAYRAQVDIPSSSNSVLQVVAMSITITDSKFLSNVGTAVGGASSLIVLEGEVVFYNNSALTGGALHLSATTILLVKNNSRIAFYNNSATISGGAIYTDYSFGQTEFDSYYDCFLYLGVPGLFYNVGFFNLTATNISMIFLYNRAPLGAVLYGSTLDVCSWAVQLKQSLNISPADQPILQVLYEKSIIFQLDQKPNTPVVFSTPARFLEVDNTSVASSYMPGQQFTLAIRSADMLNQTIQTVVTSQVFDNFVPKLGDSGYWLTSATASKRPNAVAKVYGQRNVTMSVTVYSVDTFVKSAPITVTLTECLFGFVYTENGGGDCQCSKATTSSMVTCDEDLKLFNVTEGWWIGPDSRGGTGLVYKPCLFDYCEVQNDDVRFVTVLPQAIDAQCANNRTGLLCGGCQEGYSSVFGTNRCMKCTDSTLGLLVFFAAAGIGIIAIISFLHITVSEGYINELLFYVSIVSTYEVHFTGRLPGREVFIPVFFLNLDMGFETCFYDGMTPLDRVGLSFVFPIYLFVLMVMFVWLASCSFVVSQWLAKNSFTPSKLLATLITLSYNSITQSCFQILGFATVTVYGLDDGKSSVILLWAIDPNVEYLSPLHAVLFVVTVVLLVIFVIPVPLLLILPSFTSRFIWRLKPLYDAFASPLKDKFAFWIGLRFVLRIVYFIISSFSEPPTNLLLLGVGLVIQIFLSASVQPYKSPVHNILDSFYQCNILLLALGALYFQDFANSLQAVTHKSELGFVLVVVGVAYVVTFFVLGKLILVRFPRLTIKLRALCKKHRTEPPTAEVNCDPPTDNNVVQETDSQHHPELEKKVGVNEKPQVIPMFARLREPLLDSPGFMELS